MVRMDVALIVVLQMAVLIMECGSMYPALSRIHL
jgi:hypothetical protein